MPKLRVELRNCYGIRQLDEEFKFDSNRNIPGKTKTYAIYASNGLMKSSLAKTFYAIQESMPDEPRDRMYPERKSKCNILWNGANIDPEIIYVVEPFSEKSFEQSAGAARLLANSKLKKRYDEAHKKIDAQKTDFMKKLKKISKSTDCESELVATFSDKGVDMTIYEILGGVLPKLYKGYAFYDFKYNSVFDKAGKVRNFVLKHQDLLQEYAATYERLLGESSFFSKTSSFGTYQANTIKANVKGGEFFGAGHRFKLKDADQDIQSQQEFSQVIQDEIDRIISDEDARSAFEKIDLALQSTQGLRDFQIVLSNDNTLSAKIIDYNSFKAEVWYGYLSQAYDDLSSLCDTYNEVKPEIDQILKEASNEQALWEAAIGEFNQRFNNLPFRLSVANKEDAALSISPPVVDFDFDDGYGDGSKPTKTKDLFTVLSQGEKRALYLLNIIFDIKAREADSQETVFILDDIVESFDYKNKYAIIEYLKDISDVECFYTIILTHNFDFLRTIESRGIVNYKDCKTAYRDGEKTHLKLMNGIKDPFLSWKNNLVDDQYKLTAAIPFTRNIVKYTQGESSDSYGLLTKMLHDKNGSRSITIRELNDVLDKTFDDINLPVNIDAPIQDLIIKLAGDCTAKDSEMELQEKIVISIGSRILAERYMRTHISEEKMDEIEQCENQTSKMVIAFKNENPKITKDVAKIIDRILLMTPENIHVNAFMYEPIVDLGSNELRMLFNDAQKILVRV